ncbi:hypothetical protein SAMN05428966_102160 [Massilia sp. PDC64]|nr:hypothetical protein [Massilia sp. PDC64]SDC70806.1 hypothetical protein SAMN05428966_102160 [Massilia sp. PDC64]
MNHKIDPCDTMRNNLIAAAVGLQQCTKTATNIVPIPGGDRVIAIGTPAQVRALLPKRELPPELKAAIDEAAKTRAPGALLPDGSAVFINYGDQPEDTAHLDCTACGGSGHIDDQTRAARDVLAERRRQIEVEGWTPEHDDKYTACELARAAATYATCSHIEQLRLCGQQAWPWNPDWWKRGDYRRDLVKAGALILAEIERVDRDRAASGDQVDSEGGHDD